MAIDTDNACLPGVAPFKRCTCAGAVPWRTRDDFLSDPGVVLIGYQANFEELKAGFFLFNHSCHTTLSVKVDQFLDLYDGPVFRERATNGPACQGFCLHRGALNPCPAHCECAFVREILQILRNWKKR
jgi:hypothetical protein